MLDGGDLMILAIDVGGTHTDAVLLDSTGVVGSAKVPTKKEDLLECVLQAIDQVIQGCPVEQIEKVNLSTTLTTNAIVENKGEKVGLFILPGPGINPQTLLIGEENVILSGYIDHRGREVAPIYEEEIIRGIEKLKEKNIKYIAVVGKFSTRNNKHELAVERIIRKNYPQVEDVVLGHTLSGSLNFPRRVATAYLSTKIKKIHKNFVYSIQDALKIRNISAPVFLLKADGGTVELINSLHKPVETALSGPAASIMGAISLVDYNGTAIVLDIGGTTTDLAILVDNVPLFQPKGAIIGDYKTLVRALYTKSFGLGGDSVVSLVGDQLKIGPERMGPAACLGGPCPTPTDAFSVLNLTDLGKRELAVAAYQGIANSLGLEVKEVAEMVLDKVKKIIIGHINEAINEFKDQPVYTIHELLENFTLNPDLLIGIGGPAHLIIPLIASELNWLYSIPKDTTVANAIGAGCARTTAIITLRVDTAEGFLSIPEYSYRETLSSSSRITINEAEAMAVDWIRKKASEMSIPRSDLDVEITESQSFNVVDGFYTVGRIMDITAQIKPGISSMISIDKEAVSK
jgi:N-methylhydantoinase A/oxoprolinase/acetone carboxylase beta subunit